MRRNRTRILLAIVSLMLSFGAESANVKKTNSQAEPDRYSAFSKRLHKDQKFRHALARLTFGPRPGDLEKIQKIGLEKWIDLQLDPERVPENPVVGERLQPFESLRLSIHETYVHYPPPQLIAAVARGRTPLPDDPELRAVVLHLVDRYLKKQDVAALPAPSAGQVLNGGAPDSKEQADLDLKLRLSEILKSRQIDTLRNGKPEEKKQVLASLPPEKRLDFVWALQPRERRQLFYLAPVELRRALMLSTNPQKVVANDLQEGKLLRAIYGNHQLEELLVDFWYNHFNVFIGKGGERYMVPSYEREAIRPYVFGKFYDILLATAKTPAMLFYLDNWQSVAPDSGNISRQASRKAKRGLNENYGRELLELHTLGVDGGYTQKDVVEVARCFTGWTIAQPRRGGGFEYNDKMHDKGSKIVLGHQIPAGRGMEDGLEVLDILSHHPSTAHFISLKLAQRFVADDPPPALVSRMAQTFTQTDGDLREVMRTMLSSNEFWSQGAYQAKVKSPFELIVSAVRATNAEVQSAMALASESQRLGEPLYGKLEPNGFSSAAAEWVSSAGLLDRMNFALALTHNRMRDVKVDTAEWEQPARADPMKVARSILEENPSEPTKAAIKKALSDKAGKQLTDSAKASLSQRASLIAGLLIGSPEFQHH